MEIRSIDKAHAGDINLPNEPFPLFGRLLPAYRDGAWSYTAALFPPEEVTEMTFPEEHYCFEERAERRIFVGAYEGETCVGLALWEREWHRYLYLSDLKVSRACRGRGVASALIEEGKRLAGALGLRGLYTIAQDNNLAACRFYLKCGFEIGGFNSHVYRGTAQEGKADIYFYLELDK